MEVGVSVLSRFLNLVEIFFFKQKTAYDMRISDWSSDVCSSDLSDAARAGLWAGRLPAPCCGSRRVPSRGGRGENRDGDRAGRQGGRRGAPALQVDMRACKHASINEAEGQRLSRKGYLLALRVSEPAPQTPPAGPGGRAAMPIAGHHRRAKAG